jgi:hypothetical protein
MPSRLPIRSFGETWIRKDSGLLVPLGKVLESSDRRQTNFVQIKARAQEIEDLYRDAGLRLPRGCGLARLVENAKTLSDRWLMNEMEELSIVNAFYAMHLQRIADAVLPLSAQTERKRYLQSLISGDLDFFDRGASSAKDALWELELWALICDRGGIAELIDPPDIVVALGDKTLGIACKKIYSEKNIEKVLSQAVEQVEDHYDVGIAALNIDELTPAHTLLNAKTEREMARMLQRETAEFIRRHERHFRKYLSSGRLVAAVVSVHVIANIKEWDVPFNNCRQSTAWVIPGLSPEKAALVRQFQQIVV